MANHHQLSAIADLGPNPGWNDERVEVLKELWGAGHSCSQIARKLGGITRNAVIGKVCRLGLQGRGAPSKPRMARRPPPQVKAPAAPRPVVLQPVRPTYAPVQLLALEATSCRFPLGDPTDPDFTFCGEKASRGAYCGEHAKVAYQPAKQTPNQLARSLRFWSDR